MFSERQCPPIGVHAFAAGGLALVHANDSMDPCGSCRDRHQNIGAGQIGEAPFAELLRHPLASQVPFIVETPGPKAAQAADAITLKRLRSGPDHSARCIVGQERGAF